MYSDSLLYFFDLPFIFIFCFMIIYIIVWYLDPDPDFRINPSPNWEPDPSILIDLTFLVIEFDQFQFQTSFFNILNFL